MGRKNPYGLVNNRRGGNVPGYTGFIPGKYAGSVYGRTFCDANVAATAVRRGQAGNPERVHRAPVIPDSGSLAGRATWAHTKEITTDEADERRAPEHGQLHTSSPFVYDV